MKVKYQFARPITNPVPDKPTERAPILSDEELLDLTKNCWSLRDEHAKDLSAMDGGAEVRDFYEAKITSGELRVVKTTNTVFGGEFSCQQCHGRLLKSYVCCPYCTAQIIK